MASSYRIYSLHVLNHVISARRIVTNTNRRLRRLAREQAEVRAAEAERGKKGRAKKRKVKTPKKLKQEQDYDDITQGIDATPTPIHIGDDGVEDDGWKRDQGFTRPIVLILCPMRCDIVKKKKSKCNCNYRGVHKMRVRDS